MYDVSNAIHPRKVSGHNVFGSGTGAGLLVHSGCADVVLVSELLKVVSCGSCMGLFVADVIG